MDRYTVCCRKQRGEFRASSDLGLQIYNCILFSLFLLVIPHSCPFCAFGCADRNGISQPPLQLGDQRLADRIHVEVRHATSVSLQLLFFSRTKM